MPATPSREIITGAIDKLRRKRVQALTFPKALEDEFERTSAKERSYRALA